ncbi:sorting nexin-16-like, partial [Salarias fasciatus]|uniref:sorting nexin-16-like n=1 Tax=Salarias fasciatus TaxID=181472 RepID=UPI0011766464
SFPVWVAALQLKQLFPGFRAALPPASRCRLRNSYGKEFLEERLSRLQAFLQELTSHQDVIRSEAVRRFLCLDDPPSPFDSLEESRAFCETLEEMNHHLQRELLEKQSQTDMLKKTLKEREKTIKLLLKKAQSQPFSSEGFEDFRKISAGINQDRDMTEHEEKHRRK